MHGTVQNVSLNQQAKANLEVVLSQANYTLGGLTFQTSDDPIAVFKAILTSVSSITRENPIYT